MAIRRVEGLKWALLRPQGPWPPSRPRGAKAQGMKYERELAKALPDATHGQWIEFGDRNGSGWAQPDLLLRGEKAILVLEAKLSWTFEGHQQIDQLYRPLCEEIWQKPVFGIVVTKHLRNLPRSFAVVRDLRTGLEAARDGQSVVLHWLGTPGSLLGPR